MSTVKVQGVAIHLKRKLLEILGVFKTQPELERKLKGSTDIYDVERRIQQYERDPGFRSMVT